MKTAPTNKKVRELIDAVKKNRLIPRPEFQRRLVWANKDKDHFLDTVLRGYPFPEIYVADGDVDLDTGEGTQLLVDGLQRVNTLIEYFEASPNLRLQTIVPYADLSDHEKREFLQYDVAVRDLGPVHREEIVEVFKRINATKYSLLDIEVNNAVYAGALKQYAQRVSEHDFFISNSVFNARDFKRMGDLRFALLLIATFLEGYFNRDEPFGTLLERYNDDFPLESDTDRRLNACFDYLTECAFGPRERLWKKADLLTAIVELDAVAESGSAWPDPSAFVDALTAFYERVELAGTDTTTPAGVYYKAALQATNDRVNRVRRAVVVRGLLAGTSDDNVMKELTAMGLA